MESILDQLMGSLQGSGGIEEMTRSLGLDESDVTKVISGALPALVGGLTREGGTAAGAGNLLAALDRDHDGSIMDDLAAFLGDSGNVESGAGILRHTFGDRQGRVEGALSQSTGVDAASISKVLAMLAPLVMGYLGRQRREQNLGADGLAEMLSREQAVARERSPQAVDMFTRMLDADDDGSIMDEVAEMGSSLLGSLFKQS